MALIMTLDSLVMLGMVAVFAGFGRRLEALPRVGNPGNAKTGLVLCV